VLVLAYTPVRKPPVVGVISTGPGLKSSIEEQKMKVFLAKLLGKLLPTLTLNGGVDPQMLCRDAQVVDEYIHDPLVHPLVTAGWGLAMMKAVALTYENAPRFPLPLLLMHGGNDEIAYPSSSTSFAELAPKDKVTLRIWKGYKHELHTDPEKAAVFQTMVEWLDQQKG
jgi:lysophospholipase